MECNRCGEEVDETTEVFGFCDECHEEKQSRAYSFCIRPSSNGDYASVYYNGDCLGGAVGVDSKEEVIELFKSTKKKWERYDSIAQKEGEKITKDNLFFYSCKEEIGKMELFGVKKLTDFGGR